MSDAIIVAAVFAVGWALYVEVRIARIVRNSALQIEVNQNAVRIFKSQEKINSALMRDRAKRILAGQS